MNKLNYKKCIDKLNEIIQPQISELPSVTGKENALRKVRDYMRDYDAPILYRYMPLNLYALEGIANKNIFMVPASKVNDVFEGAPYSSDTYIDLDNIEIQRIQDEIFIKSFTLNKNDNLMWSYYGDAHKGICIGYDFSKADSDIAEHLYPVQYSDTRFSFRQTNNIESNGFLFLRKSKCWKKEKEFRLIYRKEELEHFFIETNFITEIQFGLRTTPEEMELVASLVKNQDFCRNRKIKLYKTKLKENSFTLEREEYGKIDCR